MAPSECHTLAPCVLIRLTRSVVVRLAPSAWDNIPHCYTIGTRLNISGLQFNGIKGLRESELLVPLNEVTYRAVSAHCTDKRLLA